jgi:hypothetical protein
VINASDNKKNIRTQAATPDGGPSGISTSRRMTVVDRSAHGIGISFRKPTPGPESELVRWFLDKPPVTVPRACNMTVFIEPRLESGFPDMVFVQWREGRTKDWRPERLKLKSEDIRVLHSLWNAGPVSECALKNAFGRGVTAKLTRLTDADVVYYRSGTWKARPLKKIFAVERIIAVEAKTEDIQGGLQQALLNTWFASVSYLLTPHVPRAGKIADRATSFGVGLWSQKAGIVHRPISAPVPRSYASWLFNEWVWRACHFFEAKAQVQNNEHRYSLAGQAIS